MNDEFWVLPCLLMPFCYVVYRQNRKEILVEVREGNRLFPAEALTDLEQRYFEQNILTNTNK